MPPPPIPTSTRPTLHSSGPPAPPGLPPKPSKEIGPPQLHFHPSYLFELRDEKITVGAKSMSLLWPQLKNVMKDPAVHSVTYSKKFGPGGRNAFLSYAPHFHPNQHALDNYLKAHPGATSEEWEDRIPWDHKDANRNPDTGNATQAKELGAVCQKVFILALAYHFGQKWNPSVCKPSAEKAYQLLYTFFGNPETRMIPEVAYGQYERGSQQKGQFRPEGLLHIRSLIAISQVLPLLPSPPHPHSPHSFMHLWLEQHVHFLQTHPVGVGAASRVNNIQTHYLIQVATHLVALNRPVEAHNVATSLFYPSPQNPLGIERKISLTSGALPLELKRPNGLHYTNFELEPLVFLADLASSIEKYSGIQPPLVSVWPASNHALKRAVDFGIRYQLRSCGCEVPLRPLPARVKEPEQGSDPRGIVFIVNSAAAFYGRAEYGEWLVGKGADGDMDPVKGQEQGWKAPSSLLEGFNLAARWRWAMLHGY